MQAADQIPQQREAMGAILESSLLVDLCISDSNLQNYKDGHPISERTEIALMELGLFVAFCSALILTLL